MEKILSHYNISEVRWKISNEQVRHYAFTKKMLGKNIFIEFFASTPPEMDDQNEYVEKLFEQEEQDKGAFDYGTQLSVVLKHQEKHYQFLLYHSCVEIGVPVLLLQTIVFLVKLLDDMEPAPLIEHLTSLSTELLIPHEIKEKELREASHDMLRTKVQMIHNLIQADQVAS